MACIAAWHQGSLLPGTRVLHAMHGAALGCGCGLTEDAVVGTTGVGQGRGSYGLVMEELDGDRRGQPPDGHRGRGRPENGQSSRRDEGRAGHDRRVLASHELHT